MLRLLLPVIVLVTCTIVFGTEQLTPKDYGSRLAVGKRSYQIIRRLTVRVLNFEGRIVKDAVVWEGTEVTITCKMHGFSKGTHLSWTEPSGETTRPTQYGLKIEKIFNRVKQNNSGRYICNANDAGRYESGSVLLTVEATPTIRPNSAHVTAVEGKQAVLRCTGTDHTKSYSISWFYEGKGLHSDANVHISSHVHTKHTKLTIRQVSGRHSGMYECRITIGRVKISAYSQLTVVYPPKVLEGPSNVTAAVGATVAFRCNVTGSPRPAVTWERNGMPINSSSTAEAQGKYNQSSEEDIHLLTITNVQQTDSGLYSCRVHNNHEMPLFQSAHLNIQEPCSPPNITIDAIYGNGTTLFAALNWTKPIYDGNSPITAYELGCKTKSHDNFFVSQVDSSIFTGEIPCAFIHQLNQSLPFSLDLVMRVVANNGIGSTSSKLLNLTVEVITSKNNQSAFEVVIHPLTSPSTVPTLITVISTIQPSLSADSHNTSKEPRRHDVNSSFPTSSAKTPENTISENSNFYPSSLLSGDSDEITTETWYLLFETEPITTRKESSTPPQPVVQFLAETASNSTDLQDRNGAGSEGEDKLVHTLVPVAIPLALLVVFVIAGVIYRRKFRGVDRARVVTPQRHEPVESSTVDNCASVQVANELSETLTGPADSDADDCPGVLDETDVYSFCGSSLKEKIGPEGGDFRSESGNLFVSVPSGAVSNEEQIEALFFFDMDPMPIPQNCFVFSPVLELQPHGLSFEKDKLVSIYFPFTATLEGWLLQLMKEQDVEWKTVLTFDTDTQEVTDRDSHCNYDMNTRCLQLSHFCKYRWCGFSKENSSASKKTIICFLFARMDSTGNSCNFFLYLGDNCDDVIEEVKKNECSKGNEAFEFKDKGKIAIIKVGFLKIQFTGNGFEIKGKKEMTVTVDLRDLWQKTCGIQKRLHILAKRTGRTDASNDLELSVTLSYASARSQDSITVLAIFDESTRRQPLHSNSQRSLDSGVGEILKPNTTKSDMSDLPSPLSLPSDHDEPIESSSLDSSFAESENSPIVDVDKLSPTKSNPALQQSDSGGNRKGAEVLREHWKELNDNLDPELAIDELFQRKVINSQQLEEIRASQGTPRRTKAYMLLSKMLSSSDSAVRQFAEILSLTESETQKDLGERLLKDLKIESSAAARQHSRLGLQAASTWTAREPASGGDKMRVQYLV